MKREPQIGDFLFCQGRDPGRGWTDMGNGTWWKTATEPGETGWDAFAVTREWGHCRFCGAECPLDLCRDCEDMIGD